MRQLSTKAGKIVPKESSIGSCPDNTVTEFTNHANTGNHDRDTRKMLVVSCIRHRNRNGLFPLPVPVFACLTIKVADNTAEVRKSNGPKPYSKTKITVLDTCL